MMKLIVLTAAFYFAAVLTSEQLKIVVILIIPDYTQWYMKLNDILTIITSFSEQRLVLPDLIDKCIYGQQNFNSSLSRRKRKISRIFSEVSKRFLYVYRRERKHYFSELYSE